VLRPAPDDDKIIKVNLTLVLPCCGGTGIKNMFNISAIEGQMIFQVILAATLGGLIGLEREYRHRPAGFRTYFLVALGACLFTIISRYFPGEGVDPTRIAAQIVTGIGFIGAGVIFRHEEKVEGITTAAGLWVVAALGMAVASGYYFISVTITLLILAVLSLSEKLTKVVKKE
jgi:putative Mg2+ transporter-C (MgtC) family protein